MRNDFMALVAFCSASMTYGSVGSWAHPRTDPGVVDPDYYINLARALERGGFDVLFFDDRLAMPSSYGNTPRATAKFGSRAVKLDLTTILALVSAHTTRLGLGATYSTTYYDPYHVARLFATLDHMTRGRAVWNIVTSVNKAEAENFGVDYTVHDQRYDRADEFLEVVTQLWESWERDALEMNRETGVFANPDKVHEINYEGQYVKSRGPLTVPQPPQGWPVLLQAGQSGRGMQFAGRWADMIFTAPSSFESAQTQYAKQAEHSAAAGRSGKPGLVLPAMVVCVGETSEIAHRRHEYFHALASPEEELIFLSEQANFDFSIFGLDEPLPADILDRVTGVRGLIEKYINDVRAEHGPDATLRQMAERLCRNTTSSTIVGDPVEVADVLEHWFQNHAADGFVIVPTDDPGGYEDFGRLVVPELRRRGLVRPVEQAGLSLRQRLGLPDRASR